jgi:hypothetical protein
MEKLVDKYLTELGLLAKQLRVPFHVSGMPETWISIRVATKRVLEAKAVMAFIASSSSSKRARYL